MTTHQTFCRCVRALTAVAAATAAAAALTSCASVPVGLAPQQPPGQPAVELHRPADGSADELPAPGSTVAPGEVPVDGLPAGLRLAVVDPGAPGSADTLRAVDDLAAGLGATVTRVTAEPGGPSDPEALLGAAVDEGADVVVVLGTEMLDALDRVSASTLDQQFLTLGGQLPEPTANVTAVVWPGAGILPSTSTSTSSGAAADGPAPRTGEALAAGLSAVAQGTTGYVVALP